MLLPRLLLLLLAVVVVVVVVTTSRLHGSTFCSYPSELYPITQAHYCLARACVGVIRGGFSPIHPLLPMFWFCAVLGTPTICQQIDNSMVLFCPSCRHAFSWSPLVCAL